MKLIDYKKKAFLKLYKKNIEIRDSYRSFGDPLGYEKYFNQVLHALEPDFLTALDRIRKEKVNFKENNKLLDHIYVMWWQGVENAPTLIQNNIRRMQKIFGKDNVYIITEKNWKQYCSFSSIIIKKFNAGKISIAALSDIIRFNLLKKHGGLWVDSTVILSENCKGILSEYNDKDFFSISNLDNDYHYISKSKWTAWFIGGKAGYPLFEFATEFYDNYFEKHDFLIDYYTIDDIIAYFYTIDLKFKNDINSISADWHPYLMNNNINKAYDPNLFDKFDHDPLYSIQKFTYKYDESLSKNKDTVLYAILNNSFK